MHSKTRRDCQYIFQKKIHPPSDKATEIHPASHQVPADAALFTTSSRGHRTSPSRILSFDGRHRPSLKKSVLAVLVVGAELSLPARCDRCPDSTQHAPSETAIWDKLKCSVERKQAVSKHNRGCCGEKSNLYDATAFEGRPPLTFLHGQMA